MHIGLRAKLLGATLLLLSVLTLGALGAVHYYIGRQIRGQAEHELYAGGHVLASILQRTQEQLQDRGRILVELPSLRAGLTTARDQLEPLLQEVKSVRTANLVWATDAKGVVLASTAEYPALQTPLASHPLLAPALAGETVAGLDVFLGDWWLLVSLPVKDEGEHAQIGTVTLSLLLGEAYLNRLAELVGTDVGFLWEGRWFWSSSWPAASREPVSLEAARVGSGLPSEVPADDQRYLWIKRVVTVGFYPRITELTTLVGTRLDDTVIRRTARAIGWIAAAIMALGALILTGTIRSITQPLNNLVADAQRVGAGDLTHRSRVAGRDEVGALAATFNQMVGRLKRSRDDLVSTNRRLEGLLVMKDEFVEKVSHELRTPLMLIREGVKLMLEEGLGKLTPSQQEFLHVVDRQADRLTGLVNNMLDMGEASTGRLRLCRQRVEPRQLLEHVAQSYRPILGRRTLSVDCGDVPAVFADPERMSRVFGNLISNAIKFTDEQGRITVRASARDGQVAFAVEDDGRGIAPEDIPKLFEKFEQVGVRDLANPDGTGLGLIVSKELVERQQGRIEVASEPGKGSIFTVLLPQYTPEFALRESFETLRDVALFENGQTVGLIVVDAPGPADGGDRLVGLVQDLRRQIPRDDLVLELSPTRLAVLTVTTQEGLRTIVRRLRLSLGTEGALRFGAVVYPGDGDDPEALVARAASTLDQGLAEPLPA